MNVTEFIPRDYQIRAVAAIQSELRRKNSCLLAAPCAAGKTIIFSEITQWLHRYGRRTLILMDRHTLVEQNVEKLCQWIDRSEIGIACATSGLKQLSPPVVVGSRQTLAGLLSRRSDWFFHLVIIDESHLMSPVENDSQYWQIIRILRDKNPNLRILGCTATPYRLLSGKIYGPGKLFSDLDFSISTAKLIGCGYLNPLRWKIRQSDLLAQLDAVKKSSTGDLNEADQAAVLGQAKFVEGVYEAWAEHCRDKKTAIYALTISHAEAIAAVFEQHGIHAELIHSKLSTPEVKARVRRFSDGQGVIINCSILAIGSDIPSISAVILARRTLSTALFFQIVGRGARLYPGKSECLVIDLCGNALIHGIDPDNPVLQVRGEESKTPPIKICPMCEEPCSVSAKRCKCGFEFPTPEPAENKPVRQGESLGKLVDFQGFQTLRCDHVQYKLGKTKRGVNIILVFYYGSGELLAKQFLCAGWKHGRAERHKAIAHWIERGGGRPVPNGSREFMARIGELHKSVKITVDATVFPPLVKSAVAA
jgi:DNA repair protein RadD